MWIKSAMMTTASQLNNPGNPIQGQAATPRRSTTVRARGPGAGVRPGPGVRLDARWTGSRYGCAIGQFQLVTDPAICDWSRRSTRVT